MPISEALIVGLGVRQAEFGLVKKQKRGLLRLKTIGLEGLAAVIRAFAVTARLGRKNAALRADFIVLRPEVGREGQAETHLQLRDGFQTA